MVDRKISGLEGDTNRLMRIDMVRRQSMSMVGQPSVGPYPFFVTSRNVVQTSTFDGRVVQRQPEVGPQCRTAGAVVSIILMPLRRASVVRRFEVGMVERHPRFWSEQLAGQESNIVEILGLPQMGFQTNAPADLRISDRTVVRIINIQVPGPSIRETVESFEEGGDELTDMIDLPFQNVLRDD